MAGAPVVAAPPAGFKPGLEAAPIAKPVGVLEAVNAAKARQQEAVVNAKLREKAGTPAN